MARIQSSALLRRRVLLQSRVEQRAARRAWPSVAATIFRVGGQKGRRVCTLTAPPEAQTAPDPAREGIKGGLPGTRPVIWCKRHPGPAPGRARPFPRIRSHHNRRFWREERPLWTLYTRRPWPRPACAPTATIDINAALRGAAGGAAERRDGRAGLRARGRRATATGSARSTPASAA